MQLIKSTSNAGRLTVLAIILFFSTGLVAQGRYNTRVDPQNSKRKIIDLPPAVRKAAFIDEKRDPMDDRTFKRRPITFQPFEMRNPKTGKDLDPNAVLTIAMPDGTKRTTTVKQFYEQVNKMESAMAARGRSLRDPAAFKNLRPQFLRNNYNKQPLLAKDFQSQKFEVKPDVVKTTGPIIILKPITTTPVNTTTNTTLFNLVKWNSETFVAGYTETEGTTEFPAEWLKTSGMSKGRKKYPVVLQVPKGIVTVIDRIEWQVSETPFDGTLKDLNAPNIKLKGNLSGINWSNGYRGTELLPQSKNSKYCIFYVDISKIAPEPVDDVKPYFIRVVSFSKSGEILDISDQSIANYGAKDVAMVMPSTEPHTVPKFNYQFPEEGSVIPFGVFIKGQGFNSAKFKEITIKGGASTSKTLGYSLKANAALGVKYFNFLSLVSSDEPVSKPFTIVDGNFSAVLGLAKKPSGGYEDVGVKLQLSFLDGLIPYTIGFTTPVPGVPNAIQLEYSVNEPIDIGLMDMRFLVGPVPIRIAAGIKGEAGIKLYGQANMSTLEMSGGIEPYLKTSFYALGGVDAVIAFATLNAEVDPLLSLSMPMQFNSGGSSPLSLSTAIAGLAGRIFLRVGFYYPCPSLEKIVGFLTGSEPLPLCECTWEYNIFDFPGFKHEYKY